jgi:hypothetical protein
LAVQQIPYSAVYQPNSIGQEKTFDQPDDSGDETNCLGAMEGRRIAERNRTGAQKGTRLDIWSRDVDWWHRAKITQAIVFGAHCTGT